MRDNPHGKYMYGRQCVKQCPREYRPSDSDHSVHRHIGRYRRFEQPKSSSQHAVCCTSIYGCERGTVCAKVVKNEIGQELVVVAAHRQQFKDVIDFLCFERR